MYNFHLGIVSDKLNIWNAIARTSARIDRSESKIMLQKLVFLIKSFAAYFWRRRGEVMLHAV